MYRFLSIVFLIVTCFVPAMAQAPAARPTPPTRDPHTPGFVPAKELPDGANAPANQDGNFILGPTHPAVPESSVSR